MGQASVLDIEHVLPFHRLHGFAWQWTEKDRDILMRLVRRVVMDYPIQRLRLVFHNTLQPIHVLADTLQHLELQGNIFELQALSGKSIILPPVRRMLQPYWNLLYTSLLTLSPAVQASRN